MLQFGSGNPWTDSGKGMPIYPIERIRADHPGISTSAFEACAVARCRANGPPPWRLEVRCEGLPGAGSGPRPIALTWQPSTEHEARKAEKAYQARRVTEDGAIGVCAAGFAALQEGRITEVCDHGSSVDFWVDGTRAVLEVSGLDVGGAPGLAARHRQKVRQAGRSSLGKLGFPGYVFVVAFQVRQALLTYHAGEGDAHG